MTDLAFVTSYDDDLDLSPEVLCALLRRRSLRAHRDDDDDAPSGATQEALHAAWL